MAWPEPEGASHAHICSFVFPVRSNGVPSHAAAAQCAGVIHGMLSGSCPPGFDVFAFAVDAIMRCTGVYGVRL